MTSESLRSQVEKLQGEMKQLAKTTKNSTILYTATARVNILEQVLTLIDEKAKELDRQQKKSLKNIRTARKNKVSSDPEYWETQYHESNGEAYAYEVCLGIIGQPKPDGESR